MTSFPSLTISQGFRRILRVEASVKYREDLGCERVWVNRHIQHAFEIPWNALLRSERTTEDAFMQAVRGRYLGDIAFTDTWDSRYSFPAYTCRLDLDNLDMQEQDPTRWSGTLRLLEVANFKSLKSLVTAFPVLSTGAVVQLPYQMSRRYNTVIGRTPNDTEKRYENFVDCADALGLQRWAVGGDVLSDTEAADLLDCWESNGGPYGSISFTEPETGTAFAGVHFVDPQITHTVNAYNSNAVRMTLEELKPL